MHPSPLSAQSPCIWLIWSLAFTFSLYQPFEHLRPHQSLSHCPSLFPVLSGHHFVTTSMHSITAPTTTSPTSPPFLRPLLMDHLSLHSHHSGHIQHLNLTPFLSSTFPPTRVGLTTYATFHGSVISCNHLFKKKKKKIAARQLHMFSPFPSHFNQPLPMYLHHPLSITPAYYIIRYHYS